MHFKLHLVQLTYLMLICCSKQQCSGEKENAMKGTEFFSASTSPEIFDTNLPLKLLPNSKRIGKYTLTDDGCIKPDWTRNKLQLLLPKQKKINHVKDTSDVNVSKIYAQVKQEADIMVNSTNAESDSDDKVEHASNTSYEKMALNDRSDFQEKNQDEKLIFKENINNFDNGVDRNKKSLKIDVEQSEISHDFITEVPKTTTEPGNVLVEENGTFDFNESAQMENELNIQYKDSSKQIQGEEMLSSDPIVKTNMETKRNEDTGNNSQINVEMIPSNTDESINLMEQTEAVHNTSHKSDAEEVPIPVFSEWTQKQMEAEANKIEQEQLNGNISAQKRNNTNGNGKSQQLKFRAKNYAAPDCGAKILASNSESENSDAVLSHSRDEYMLNPCGAKIWFIVELCEAIQVQRIELANFELFSSSPKNFTVAVSNRIPTREWSNVGHFTAGDKRTVQSFTLYPDLFGKFVRVDIQSYYSTEHFCPVSLFRVYGTSEIEAFETEIGTRNDDDDDFYDELDRSHAKGSDNIFKSASDAVIKIVKKAAEVLVKPTTTDTLNKLNNFNSCRTPAFETFTCDNCNNTILVARINNVLSCELQQLENLLSRQSLRLHLQKTDTCSHDYGINVPPLKYEQSTIAHMHKNNSYFLNILPLEYIGALCKLLSLERVQTHLNIFENSPVQQEANYNNISVQLSQQTVTEFDSVPIEGPELHQTVESSKKIDECSETTTENDVIANASITVNNKNNNNVANFQTSNEGNTVTNDEAFLINAPDVNIYNVPSSVKADLKPITDSSLPNVPNSNNDEVKDTAEDTEAKKAQIEITQATVMQMSSLPSRGSDDETTTWDGIENILDTTVPSTTTGNNAPIASGGNGINVQQKLTNGAAQSESVLIRLSNRVKTLERNMSLSGQYLEELSRRYKKQVEELQQTLIQHTLTVRALEEQNGRYIAKEHIFIKQNIELSNEVRNLSFQLQCCFTIVIIVSSITLLLLVVGSVYYRRLQRQTQEIALVNAVSKSNPTTILYQKNLNRRKSFEDFSDHQSCLISKKKRRPSEEAMLILKDCGDTDNLRRTKSGPISTRPSSVKRQRKLSVCYGNINYINNKEKSATGLALTKRKGSRHSFHVLLDNSTDLLEDHKKEMYTVEDKFGDAKSIKVNQLHNPSKSEDITFPDSEVAYDISHSAFEEKLLLDNDELDFLPHSDLAYNEFMPDGPSGYQTRDMSVNDCKNLDDHKIERRLSAPTFFRSPFGRGRIKIGSKQKKQKTQSGHAATSWEWCRNNISNEKQQQKVDLEEIPRLIAKMNSPSHLEMNLPKQSRENSFQKLDRALQLSEDFQILKSQNEKRSVDGSNSSSSSISNSSERSGSNASNSEKTGKKKHRSLNKIFRNVF